MRRQQQHDRPDRLSAVLLVAAQLGQLGHSMCCTGLLPTMFVLALFRLVYADCMAAGSSSMVVLMTCSFTSNPDILGDTTAYCKTQTATTQHTMFTLCSAVPHSLMPFQMQTNQQCLTLPGGNHHTGRTQLMIQGTLP